MCRRPYFAFGFIVIIILPKENNTLLQKEAFNLVFDDLERR